MDLPPQVQASGPALVRLLARFAGADAPSPPPSETLPLRLSQWIDWPQAVGLSAALDTRASRPADDADRACPTDEDREVHARLVRAIERDRAFADGAAAPRDSAVYRQRYSALQQVMVADVDLLRRRLRHHLMQRGDALARLAAVDAALEKSVGERERSLLATLPARVADHFERLRAAAGADASPGGPDTWLIAFQRDMKRLLVAELDLRLQPARALLGALRTPSDLHAQ